MPGGVQSSGDTGSGAVGVTMNGAPVTAPVAPVTVGHTWVIIVGAIALLWLLGGFAFKSIRM